MWYNAIMATLLKSPLHRLFSKNMLLISYQGRKSGRTYTTPVNYARVNGHLAVASYLSRYWWRNLRGGQPVSLTLQGRQVDGTAETIEDETGVRNELLAYLQAANHYARYFQVNLDDAGRPSIDDVCAASVGRVMIRINLAE